ncbi:MAG: hypothetical protein M1838_000163 [Thelocarpon superellum]|nr:MAG: hypothetical protein M1838_000163 [Thelocarpon superellum]
MASSHIDIKPPIPLSILSLVPLSQTCPRAIDNRQTRPLPTPHPGKQSLWTAHGTSDGSHSRDAPRDRTREQARDPPRSRPITLSSAVVQPACRSSPPIHEAPDAIGGAPRAHELWLASCVIAKLAGPYRAGTQYALDYPPEHGDDAPGDDPYGAMQQSTPHQRHHPRQHQGTPTHPSQHGQQGPPPPGRQQASSSQSLQPPPHHVHPSHAHGGAPARSRQPSAGQGGGPGMHMGPGSALGNLEQSHAALLAQQHITPYQWPSPQYASAQPLYGYHTPTHLAQPSGAKRRRTEDVSDLSLLGLHSDVEEGEEGDEEEGDPTALSLGMARPGGGPANLAIYHASMQPQQQQHHHHRLPDHSPPTKQARREGGRPSESAGGPPSVVGQEGMPEPAPAPRGPKLKFTSDDDQLLVELKENKNLTWKQIADFFPGRSSGTLQVRYCTKLKAKTTQWTDETTARLRNAIEEYEQDRWRIVAGKVGNGFSPAACRDKAKEL